MKIKFNPCTDPSEYLDGAFQNKRDAEQVTTKRDARELAIAEIIAAEPDISLRRVAKTLGTTHPVVKLRMVQMGAGKLLIERKRRARLNHVARLNFENPVRLDRVPQFDPVLGLLHDLIPSPTLAPDEILMAKERWEEEQKYRDWQHRRDEPSIVRKAQLRESLLGFNLSASHQRQREEAHA